MLESGGIGTVLKNLIQNFQRGSFNLRLIVHPQAAEKYSWLSSFDLIFAPFPIYSVREQLQLPFIVPSCDIFWSPHFNVPLLPVRAKRRVVTINDMYHIAFSNDLRPI